MIFTPSWILWLAADCFSACESVFATRKSTPCTSARIMLAMALPPAPPTPITAIRGQVDSAVAQLRDGVDPETLLPGLSAAEDAYGSATAELVAIQECNVDAITGE